MKDFRDVLNGNCIEHFGFRIMECIEIGIYKLSIQASRHHYCTPQKLLTDLYEYEEMEVGIFTGDEWCNLEEDIFFDTWENRENFLKHYDGMVASYVPIEIIQSLYEYIEDKKNKFAI